MIKNFKYIFALSILVLLQMVTIFLTPIMIKDVFERIQNEQFTSLSKLTIGIITVILVYGAAKILYSFVYTKFMVAFKVEYSKKLYKKYFNIKMKIINKYDPTYFVTRIKECYDQEFKYYGETIPTFSIALLTIILSLLIAYSVNPIFFFLFLLIAPLNLIAYKRINHKLMLLSGNLQHIVSNAFKNIIIIVQGTEYIKAINKSDHYAKKISEDVKVIEEENSKMMFIANSYSNIIELAIEVLKYGIIIASIYLYSRKLIGFSEIIYINMLLQIFFNATNEIKNANLNLRDLNATKEFITNAIDKNQEEDASIRLSDIYSISVGIDEFSYDSANNVVNNVNFKIDKKIKYQLCGDSGKGKTTIIRLLMGLYDSKGIEINGLEIESISKYSIRENIEYVSQNITLFPGSIIDNIVCGSIISNEKINAIMNLKFLKQFRDMENGFNTVISENGSNLSGGQKQKIGIARMLVNNKSVIILDEAFSAIDKDSEAEIIEEIESFLSEKIVIFVSHREPVFNNYTKIAI